MNLARIKSKTRVEKAIDQLDEKYRVVYIMKEVEEMPLKEVAEALNLTLSNVKVRSHRTKEMLKDKLFELSNDKNIFEFGYSRCDRITEQVMKNI